MLREEDNNKDRLAGGSGNRRAYLRSVSWTDRSPNKPNPIPRRQPNGKGRSLLPPLQPLSINRRPVEQWPRAGSDDLGMWPNPQTPRVSVQALESSSLEQQPVEFEFKKDKLAFFDKECSRIADHIYLGSDAVAKNREILRKNGITHVLNCVGFVCPEYFKSELVYKTLWLQDSPSEDITSILYDVFDYFEDVREEGERVFVHCCQGVSRSTSLVIAYLMWREGQSFEDAFQYVKAARGVTNPNMGFACQLLLCQKRVHAMPASPNSMLRIYRMAPHSSYDPLHLVPKMLNLLGTQRFDTRGAFIVHVPSAIIVWIGKNCNWVMSNRAREAANQVIRYEKAQGPIKSIKEGEEPSEFWDALAGGQFLADECNRKEIKSEEASFSGCNKIATAVNVRVGERNLSEYDLDFELFHEALTGGVVPPFSVSNAGSETCLPARENGWGRLRNKFVNGIMKEFVASKLNYATSAGDESNMIIDIGKESEDVVSLADFASPSSPPADLCGSSDSFDCFSNASPNRIIDTCKEGESSIPFSDPLLSLTLPCSSPDLFSCFPGSSPQLSSKSPTLSPSTSDYSSSFTFSPTSCNWSDLSRQLSPSGPEAIDPFYGRYTSLADNSHSPCEETASSPKKVYSGDHTSGVANSCLPCKGNFPSIAERRGNNPPSRLFPSASKPSIAPRKLVRSWSFSLPDLDNDEVKDMNDNQFVHEGDMEELMLDADTTCSRNDSHDEIEDNKEYDEVHFSSGMIDKMAEMATPVIYQWPALNKVGTYSSQILDSRSVYVLLAPDMSLGTNELGITYVWLGREVLCENGQPQLISNSHTCKDGHLQLETIGHMVINQMGLPMDASIKIVREGEEPEQFLEHLNCFSFRKANNNDNH